MTDYLAPIQISADKLFTEFAKVRAYIRFKNNESSVISFMKNQHCVEYISFINRINDIESCLINNKKKELIFTIRSIYIRHIADGSDNEINITYPCKTAFLESYANIFDSGICSELTNKKLTSMLDCLYTMVVEVKKLIVTNLKQASVLSGSTKDKHLAKKLSSGASDASDVARIPDAKHYILPSSDLLYVTEHVDIPDIIPRETIQICRGKNSRLNRRITI